MPLQRDLIFAFFKMPPSIAAQAKADSVWCSITARLDSEGRYDDGKAWAEHENDLRDEFKADCEALFKDSTTIQLFRCLQNGAYLQVPADMQIEEFITVISTLVHDDDSLQTYAYYKLNEEMQSTKAMGKYREKKTMRQYRDEIFFLEAQVARDPYYAAVTGHNSGLVVVRCGPQRQRTLDYRSSLAASRTHDIERPGRLLLY